MSVPFLAFAGGIAPRTDGQSSPSHPARSMQLSSTAREALSRGAANRHVGGGWPTMSLKARQFRHHSLRKRANGQFVVPDPRRSLERPS